MMTTMAALLAGLPLALGRESARSSDTPSVLRWSAGCCSVKRYALHDARDLSVL